MKLLIVIPTPIGHMDDVSNRVRQSLSSVEVLFCESISNTKKLYQLLGLACPKLIRFWQKTEQTVLQSLDALAGEKIGLITDAGMPCISDPGYTLVKSWHERNWPVTVLPGPSAVTTAIALSGIPSDSFQFLGFLAPKSSACQKQLRTLKLAQTTGVLYESPHRILRLCEDIIAVYGEQHMICVMKELSKSYESVYRGAAREVVKQLQASVVKGEYCVVIDRVLAQADWQRDVKVLRQYLSLSDAASCCAEMHSVSRSLVYRYLTSLE